ncbi:MAG: 30S ribosomal protein S20 [Planctomycetes bacterium]|nr:30S ribosomal protein S20 [Planctomycetota bacterium]MBI3833991.1 30S ribosomal protein S20 [Planctomycetota bacterium]
MPNTPSAAKRVKQSDRNRSRNRAQKSMLKTETSKLIALLAAGSVDAAKKSLSTVSKKIDQAAAKGTLHANTAARRKSRLARRVNATKGKGGG